MSTSSQRLGDNEDFAASYATDGEISDLIIEVFHSDQEDMMPWIQVILINQIIVADKRILFRLIWLTFTL